jgi:thiosulfate/3-mercaptopyruvate sulfurtransferase
MRSLMAKYSASCAPFVLAVLCAVCAHADAQQPHPAAAGAPAAAEIPAGALLQPAELAQLLRSPGGEKPLILQVGSHVLYAEAHIPGSEYAGAAGEDSGLQALRDRVRSLERNRLIVIYCGCCPWSRCPNIRPAYRELVSLGFSRVKALYLADDFGRNWVAQGYPIVQGR